MTSKSNVAMMGLCPSCVDGRLLLAKERATGTHFVICENCAVAFVHPAMSRDVTFAKRDGFGDHDLLSLAEAEQHAWRNYLT